MMDEIFFLIGVLVGLSMPCIFSWIERGIEKEVENGPV